MDCPFGGCWQNSFGICIENDINCPFLKEKTQGDDIMPKSPICPVCGSQYFWYRYINGKEILSCGNELCKYHEETTVKDYRKMINQVDE